MLDSCYKQKYLKINNSFQVIETLTTISSSSKYNNESTSMARCLAHGLSDFELIVSLCVSRHLLSHFKSVTVSLQGVGIDVITGFRMIKPVKRNTPKCKFYWMHVMFNLNLHALWNLAWFI